MIQDENGATLTFRSTATDLALPQLARTSWCMRRHALGLRKQLHPDEGPPRYSGVNMWRGTAIRPPFLTGATMTRAGWLATGKMVVYPISDNVDGAGSQLVNWVAEIETPRHA